MIQKDKVEHLVVGMVTGCCALAYGFSKPHTILLSVLMAMYVGVWKEVYDAQIKRTKAECADFLATAAGGVLTGILIYFFK